MIGTAAVWAFYNRLGLALHVNEDITVDDIKQMVVEAELDVQLEEEEYAAYMQSRSEREINGYSKVSSSASSY